MKNFYVVTGASSGIGFALCCHLASRQKNVVAIARNEAGLKLLKEKNPDFITTISADLSTQAGRESVVKKILGLGKVAGLINNAASVDPLSLLQELSIEAWHQLNAINVDAPLFLTQGLLPLINTGGRIINITTGSTRFVVSGAAAYSMTKAAVNIFSKYLSEELCSKEIYVTAAHPGVVKTALVENITQNGNAELGIVKAQEKFKNDKLYLDVNLPAKFLSWLLLDADKSLYTGDIIGIYNQTYQPLWHDGVVPSPYPDNIAPP